MTNNVIPPCIAIHNKVNINAIIADTIAIGIIKTIAIIFEMNESLKSSKKS